MPRTSTADRPALAPRQLQHLRAADHGRFQTHPPQRPSPASSARKPQPQHLPIGAVRGSGSLTPAGTWPTPPKAPKVGTVASLALGTSGALPATSAHSPGDRQQTVQPGVGAPGGSHPEHRHASIGGQWKTRPPHAGQGAQGVPEASSSGFESPSSLGTLLTKLTQPVLSVLSVPPPGSPPNPTRALRRARALMADLPSGG